jgi:predicted SAM-dependent methyltransferase
MSAERFANYLSTALKPALHIGCGPVILQDWLNIDLTPAHESVVAHDATTPFPCPNDVFRAVFSEHFLEHLTLPDGVQLLRECYRVLAPGGRIRIATPDLARLARLVEVPVSAEAAAYSAASAKSVGLPPAIAHPTIAFNLAVYNHGHRFLYDESLLRRVLLECGFVNPERFDVGQSATMMLYRLEHHGKVIGDEAMNAFETMVIEAEKGG